ncbi:MAG: hypothetical protein P4L76_01670 [Beijerinckiaceae bacterium]|nr:hypothetical protein [Beijerinckiaceae bacterium]
MSRDNWRAFDLDQVSNPNIVIIGVISYISMLALDQRQPKERTGKIRELGIRLGNLDAAPFTPPRPKLRPAKKLESFDGARGKRISQVERNTPCEK